MLSIQTLQNELFNNNSSKIINNSVITQDKCDAFKIDQIEATRRTIQHNEITPDSPIFIIIDNYEKPLGSVRLIVSNQHDCQLEFSNDIMVNVNGGVSAEDLFNTLYFLFGQDFQKVRMTSYINELKYFPYSISEIDNDFLKNVESKIMKTIVKTIDISQFKDDNEHGCKGCKCWDCGSGKTCNFLNHSCK